MSATDIFLSAINSPLRRAVFPELQERGGRRSAIASGALARMRLAIHRNQARGPYQSITLQQFIEIIRLARQGIVIFFTISSPCLIPTLLPCQPPFGVSVNELA
jgi:hypothetical protein